MKYSIPDKIKDYVFLFLVVIIAYWPVSFMLLSVKNDAINYFLAMRINTSEAIQYNYFPSWSAYINMGYPLHADMQSGVWNPVVFLMSLVKKYDIYWLHAETIIVIFFSGISMYHLLKYFKLSRTVILTVACAYMLNGYVTDAGQFLNWLYAAAFLPFVFLSTIRCFTSFNIKDAFLLGFSFSLMLLCAYPADFILYSYILAIFILIAFFRYKKNNGFAASFKKFGVQLLIAGATFIIICLPALLSYFPFLNSISRGSGVDIDMALSNSMAPANFISFISPWATQRGAAFEATDPLIRNCSIGVILFIFFLFFFFQQSHKTFVQNFLAGIFIVFVVFSLGRLGGIRVLSYYTLPLMNAFRHPANAKLFFIFAGQVLAAFSLNKYLNNDFINTRVLKKITSITLIIVALALLTGLLKSNILAALRGDIFSGSGSWASRLKELKNTLSFSDLLFLNTLFILPVLLFFYRALAREQLKKYILFIVLIEMIVVAQGMLPLTYVRKSSPAVVQQILNQQPSGYPLPDTKHSIADYSTGGMNYFEQMGCMNPYNKKPGRSDYIISPANLKWQEQFWDYSSFREKIIKYPLAYFADTIYNIGDTLAFISSHSVQRACITDEPTPVSFTPGDKRIISFTKFTPGSIIMETESDKQELLVLLQNNYYNWAVYVNGEKKTIVKTNLSFMGVVVPPGKSKVEFIYKSGLLKYLGLFSLLFITSGLIFISLSKRRS
jgi:hypothetical protein